MANHVNIQLDQSLFHFQGIIWSLHMQKLIFGRAIGLIWCRVFSFCWPWSWTRF